MPRTGILYRKTKHMALDGTDYWIQYAAYKIQEQDYQKKEINICRCWAHCGDKLSIFAKNDTESELCSESCKVS